MSSETVDLDDDMREAAAYLADSDNPLAPIARLTLHLDRRSPASSSESASDSSTAASS